MVSIRALRSLSLSAVVCAFALGSAPHAAIAVQPNVIVVMTDDQGYGDLAAHGNPILNTPNLDQLHAESVRLTDFHVSAMCTPSRGQLMSGSHALANGAMGVSSGRALLRTTLLSTGEPIRTMANFFADGGYKTALFGKWHLGDNYPYRPQDRGFQEVLTFKSSYLGAAADHWNNDYFNDFYIRNGVKKQYSGYCTDVIFQQALNWMKARKAAGERFFIYLTPNAPHGPLFVPQVYRDFYPGLTHDQASLFGMIENLDENMGKLEQTLVEEGLRDNTIVIFMTDNGTKKGASVFNADMKGTKESLYEGGHRVPFFIRWPAGGLRSPGAISELTQAQDILPTLIDLAGLPNPGGTTFDGTSLARLLRGQDQTLPDRTLFVQYARITGTIPKKWDSAVLWNKWRLIKNRELYDITNDPGQTTNVIASNPTIVNAMRSAYESWWTGVKPNVNVFSRITIGADAANPVRLAPSEWRNVFLDQQYQVRLGKKKIGVWTIKVDRAGVYEISLRRWPIEADAAISAGVPAYTGVDGSYVAGVALPIAKARLRVGSFDQTVPVTATDKAITFNVTLPVGNVDLQTWFRDANNVSIASAYYVYVKRL